MKMTRINPSILSIIIFGHIGNTTRKKDIRIQLLSILVIEFFFSFPEPLLNGLI